MGIRRKLLLTLCLAFLCFAAIFVWSFEAYGRINRIHSLTDDSQKMLRRFYDMALLSGAVYYDSEKTAENLKKMALLGEENAERVRAFIQESSRLNLNEDLTENIRRLEKACRLVSYRIDILRRRIDSGGERAINRALLTQEALVDDTDLITRMMETINRGFHREARKIQNRNRSLTAALLSLFGLSLFGVIARISSAIVKNLQLIGTDMETVAQGRTIDHSIKVPSDEIGRLYRSLMKIMQRQQKNAEKLSEANRELTQSLSIIQETQAHLVESEKIAALGSLVSGVAHEINTPLGTGITAASYAAGKLEELEEELKGRENRKARGQLEDLGRSIRLIRSGLETSAGLVRQFKDISVEQYNLRKKSFVFGDAVQDALLYMRSALEERGVVVRLNIPEGISMRGDPDGMTQVFLLLMENSLIHGFPEEQEEPVIALRAEEEAGLLKIFYGDNGRGIPLTESGRIFEPFHTSDRNKGKGLGLSVVHNVVREVFRGTIRLDPAGEGCRFRIELPCGGPSPPTETGDIHGIGRATGSSFAASN